MVARLEYYDRLCVAESDLVVGCPGNQIVEGALKWLVVRDRVVDRCCEGGISNALPAIVGVIEGVTDEHQDQERTDCVALGNPESDGQEDVRVSLHQHSPAAVGEEICPAMSLAKSHGAGVASDRGVVHKVKGLGGVHEGSGNGGF